MFREKYPAIPWANAASMRHVLAHGYDIVRYDIVCQTIRTDFPPLITQLAALLASLKDEAGK